ncbi:VCBS repeat-containing protein [Streptomyces yaanensis]|uniref:VCBS repeat-containing protein n=1 Tax=Streptomyces yaanensis TaxID=1142239 RepID=A0ABV7SAH5_9ACTN|nr:VCBS repeat-containing protein [Streptomyces sp. CGMCC 4.7035]WNB96655.1 VCBS repeat-containing protein [Streptomyces sp. CGMCC 4.7035]
MGRHALRRGGLTAAVSSLAVAVAAVVVVSEGGESAEAVTAQTAGTTEIVLDDPRMETPRSDRLLAAGATGFLHRQANVAGLLWTSYENGSTVTVNTPPGNAGAGQPYQPTTTSCWDISVSCPSGMFGQSADTVALPHRTYTEPVSLANPDGSVLRTLDMPRDTYIGTYGTTVVAAEHDPVIDGVGMDGTWLKLLDYVDGKQRNRWVTGFPTDKGYVTGAHQRTGDAAGALLTYPTAYDATTGSPTSYDVGYLDFATAEFTKVFTGADTGLSLVLTDDRIGWYSATGGLHLKSRADLTAEETVPVAATGAVGSPVLVGNWLVLVADKSTVTAVSLTDGSTKTLLTRSYGDPVATPSGGALVTGGTNAADWWVHRITQGADGSPVLEKLYKVAPYENAKTGLALSRGSLRVAEDSTSSTSDSTSVRTLTTNGSTELTASAATESSSISPKCPYPNTTCSAMWGNYDGVDARDVYLDTYYDNDEGGSGLENADRLVNIGYGTLEFHTEGGTIVDVSDDYAVYNSGGTTPMQYVGEFGQGQKLKRSVRAAALNGPTLWSATTTAGRLTSYSLTENKTLATVTVPDLSCVPSELQAAGRWVYWACGTSSAGVYDTRAGTARPVTPGDVLLGDGFTVRHDHEADQLILTEAATGTTRVIASKLPDTGLAVDRRYRWTVDEYTGLVAWFDAYEQTHVATTGVTPSVPTAFHAEAEDIAEPPSSDPWHGNWFLSRPATSWSLTFTSVQSGATGKATRTITGGATSGWVSATWNGRTASGGYFPNGQFTWTLKATGLGTSTAANVTTGKGFLLRGAAVRHDFTSPDGPDGRGDLLTLNSSGGLTFHSGTGTGKFSSKYSATGWPTTITAIPFGDLSGDRCNDLLVRYSNGSLRLYKPGCNKAATPSTAYTTLGTSGWNQYDMLTSPGDISSDGRPDLVARNASTGDIYLYKGTSTGKLSARVKIFANWKTYKKIVGVGDITGDGIGDLIAQDKSNNLYRYNGTSTGTFKARAQVFTNWGGSYNAIVGVGDITDDGKPDIVSRDSSGNVWRNNGDGKGSFGSRTQIATGWGGYKSLS